MTNAQVVDLLVTYGDALEATHPLPADRTARVALVIDADDDFVPTLELPLPEAPAVVEHRSGRLALLALGLAAALALVIGFVLLSDDDNVRTGDGTDSSGFIFEGETVIREDPLVVISNQPVEPTFDTSDLGERIIWESPYDLDEAELNAAVDQVVETTEMLFGDDDIEIRRIALHAILDSGAMGVAIADIETQPLDGSGETEIARRQLVYYGSGAKISGPSGPDDASLELRPADTFEEYLERNPGLRTFSYGGGGAEEGIGEVSIELEVSLDIAVVQIVVDGERFWTVPIDGLVYFTPTMELHTQFELTAYDADGNVVTSRVSGFPK